MIDAYLAGVITGLVLGALVLAMVDRIRGARTVHAPARLTGDGTAERPLKVVDEADPLPRKAPRAAAPAPKPARAPESFFGPAVKRALSSDRPVDGTQLEVVAALVDAGYQRDAAMKAVTACTSNERLTIETWTAAALRRALVH